MVLINSDRVGLSGKLILSSCSRLIWNRIFKFPLSHPFLPQGPKNYQIEASEAVFTHKLLGNQIQNESRAKNDTEIQNLNL